jgi:MHS family proline/betaine transporter-like MFS transporter
VSTAAFGGTAPLIITALIASTGSTLIPAYYVMGAAVVAIIPIALIPETARISISHPTRIPGVEPAAATTSPAPHLPRRDGFAGVERR